MTDFNELSDEELLALLKKRKNDASKYKVMQMGLKVTLNSAYGMIGNQYSRYYDIRIAEGITVSGQLSIQWIQRKLNEFLNRYLGMEGHDFSIAGDTDSIYLSLKPFVDKITEGRENVPKQKIVKAVDQFCEQVIQPVINDAYEELADYMNAYAQKMFMAREVIADKGVWRAKKNYALNVWNSEGVAYDTPKLKIMGMESVRSSTPEFCREGFEDVIRLVLNSTEKDVQEYIREFRERFMKLPVEEIAFPRGVSDIDKWKTSDDSFKSGTPIHVKAALVYNKLVNEHNVKHKYPLIQNGDKVKFVYLKGANPTFNNAIAFPNILPPEFGLERYVNRVLQYEKAFLKPVESVLDVIGWSAEKRATLSRFL